MKMRMTQQGPACGLRLGRSMSSDVSGLIGSADNARLPIGPILPGKTYRRPGESPQALVRQTARNSARRQQLLAYWRRADLRHIACVVGWVMCMARGLGARGSLNRVSKEDLM